MFDWVLSRDNTERTEQSMLQRWVWICFEPFPSKLGDKKLCLQFGRDNKNWGKGRKREEREDREVGNKLKEKLFDGKTTVKSKRLFFNYFIIIIIKECLHYLWVS